MHPLYTFLRPILWVRDLEAEAQFYNLLGFAVKREAEQFVSVQYGDTLWFGLSMNPDFSIQAAPPLIWQIGVPSVREVQSVAEHAALTIVETSSPQDWGEWTLKLKSPNGYVVVFEGQE